MQILFFSTSLALQQFSSDLKVETYCIPYFFNLRPCELFLFAEYIFQCLHSLNLYFLTSLELALLSMSTLILIYSPGANRDFSIVKVAYTLEQPIPAIPPTFM